MKDLKMNKLLQKFEWKTRRWNGFSISVVDNEIAYSYPSKDITDWVTQLELAQQVIDKFLKNPITKTQIEYIKYP